MKTINDILQNIETLSDEICSIDIPNGEARNLVMQLNRIHIDLENLQQSNDNKINIDVLKNNENWQNKQIRDFFVRLYPEIHNIAIDDFHRALGFVIDYKLFDENEPVDKAYLAGDYLAELYLKAHRKNEDDIDICGIVLEKALKKFESDFSDDEYLTGGFVDYNSNKSKIVGFDCEIAKRAIESHIQNKGTKWFEKEVSNTSKAIITQNFGIDINSLLENFNKENHIKKRR